VDIDESGNASGMVSAARSAYNRIREIFSAPVTIKAKVEKEEAEDSDGSKPRTVAADSVDALIRAVRTVQ